MFFFDMVAISFEKGAPCFRSLLDGAGVSAGQGRGSGWTRREEPLSAGDGQNDGDCHGRKERCDYQRTGVTG